MSDEDMVAEVTDFLIYKIATEKNKSSRMEIGSSGFESLRSQDRHQLEEMMIRGKDSQ